MFEFLAPKPRELRIQAEWDPVAGVWVVTSEDLPGLATEAATQEEVQAKLLSIIPELFELNGIPAPTESVPMSLLIHSEQRVDLSC